MASHVSGGDVIDVVRGGGGLALAGAPREDGFLLSGRRIGGVFLAPPTVTASTFAFALPVFPVRPVFSVLETVNTGWSDAFALSVE